MIEVYPQLHVGSSPDVHGVLHDKIGRWAIVHACKDPWHRQLLGYSGRSAPKEHPEYLYGVRGARMFMNLIDAPTAEYIAPSLIQAALDFIDSHRRDGYAVLLHCNQGMSRSPTIALLYLAQRTDFFEGEKNLERCVERFKNAYPTYEPGPGMMGFLRAVWPQVNVPGDWPALIAAQAGA